MSWVSARALTTMIGRSWLAADLADDGEPVRRAEHQVDDHQVGRGHGDRRDGVLARHRLGDVVALVLQRPAQCRADVVVVLDDEQSQRHGRHAATAHRAVSRPSPGRHGISKRRPGRFATSAGRRWTQVDARPAPARRRTPMTRAGRAVAATPRRRRRPGHDPAQRRPARRRARRRPVAAARRPAGRRPAAGRRPVQGDSPVEHRGGQLPVGAPHLPRPRRRRRPPRRRTAAPRTCCTAPGCGASCRWRHRPARPQPDSLPAPEAT